uniref:Zinc finger PHD-type domain-containing protein n=1 Tax=Panagrolaimus davidi TaxID=227884 RepID=A0A914PVX8_9BILA
MNDSADYVAFKTFFNLHKNAIDQFLSLNHSELSDDEFRIEASIMLSSEIMDDKVYSIILNHPIYSNYFTEEQKIRCQIARYLAQAKDKCTYIQPFIFEASKIRRRSNATIKDSTISKKPSVFDIDEVECRAGKDACIHPIGKSIVIKCMTKGCNNFYHFTCIPWNLKTAETCDNFKCQICLGI